MSGHNVGRLTPTAGPPPETTIPLGAVAAASGVIPTISAAVSSVSTARSPTMSQPRTDFDCQSNMQIVQQKLRKDGKEMVLAIFEAYQIIGQEYSSRVLALIVSEICGTYACFSFTAARLPLTSTGDLTIDKIFPLNDSFNICTNNKGAVSQMQFDMQNADEKPAKFFYYPSITLQDATDFDTFHAHLTALKKSMMHSVNTTASDASLSYSWLNNYRQVGEVKQEMKRREHEYVVFKDFKIYCATWNVNNKSNRDSPLHLWLSAGKEAPDIYAIALQELDTSAKAVTFGENRPDSLWIQKMLESVHNGGVQYEELTSVRLVGIMLTVIVRKDIRRFIVRHRVKSIARGILNVVGNKGGVAVSLQLNEGNICFVNSHLAAHLKYVDARNEDYAGIVSGLLFDDHPKAIHSHDHVFWIGDLNYRIEEPPNLQLPTLRSEAECAEILMKYDQLRREMRQGHCFKDYTEGAIRFRPTYKYDVDTDNYDSSEKQRAPAYCDRILWRGPRIEQTAYNSVMEIRSSDHKPVYACFRVKIKTKDEQLYKRVHEEVLKLVDKRENENQPQITVEKTIIDFGLVQFNETFVRDFNVANSCSMAVEFMFKVKDPPLNEICEPWLYVEPRSDCLLPDSAKSIRVKLLADVHSIRALLKKMRLSSGKFDFDILILHVKNGPDIFLTVTGEYKPSCFGLSMETLCRTDRPVCDYNQSEVRELMNNNSNEFLITMPREFFLLIDYLHKHNNRIEGAFLNTQYRRTRRVQFNEVRDWLDTWSNNTFPGTPLDAADALLMLLDLSEQPLLHPYVDEFMQTTTSSEAMDYVALLSSPKRNVFMHLCMFLREGIERRHYMAHDVATTFGKVLLRHEGLRSRQFMARFITADLGAMPYNNDKTKQASGTGGAAGDNMSARLHAA